MGNAIKYLKNQITNTPSSLTAEQVYITFITSLLQCLVAPWISASSQYMVYTELIVHDAKHSAAYIRQMGFTDYFSETFALNSYKNSYLFF